MTVGARSELGVQLRRAGDAEEREKVGVGVLMYRIHLSQTCTVVLLIR